MLNIFPAIMENLKFLVVQMRVYRHEVALWATRYTIRSRRGDCNNGSRNIRLKLGKQRVNVIRPEISGRPRLWRGWVEALGRGVTKDGVLRGFIT